VRDAIASGPASPQPDRTVARFTHGSPPATSEDCLYLDVFTPSLEGARPVFVWIHGGGFAIGHGAATLYDGARFATAADAVVVSINYRLGSLGWLAHPALAEASGAPAANWGLLDQIAALRWVRENVGAFGGDPARVTVAGQSAGALCALDMLTAPAAEGLFARVAAQSPPLGDVAQPAEEGIRWAEALSAALGGTGRFDLGRLRTASANEIVAAHEALLGTPAFRGTRGALPTIDPATLPRSPREDAGARPDVELLIGATADEGTFFFGSPWRPAPPAERIPGIVAHLCPGADPAAVIAAARAASERASGQTDPVGLLVEIATEAMVAGPVREYAHARARAITRAGRAARVYRYRVDHPGGGPQLRATHTAEVPLLFGTWADGGPGERLGGGGPDPRPVAAALVAAWREFVHVGAPGWAPAGEVAVFGGVAARRIVTDVDGFI
jgi:para-nitrobenzyl esterase